MKNILLVAFFTLVHSSLVAQWEFTNGPFGSYINHLDHNNHFVFAATTAGIFKSADGGLTWEHRAFAPGTAYACLQFDLVDSVLIADAVELLADTALRHFYKSVDEGESWVELPRHPIPTYFNIAIVGKLK